MDYKTGPYIAFHNDTALQTKMLEQVDVHVSADRVIQGEYNLGEGIEFRGCFIGCTIHALKNGDTTNFNSNQGVFEAYGFPAPLTRICESIFEGVPSDKAPAFFHAVPNSLNIGSDLSLVHWKFLSWMLKDTMGKYGNPEIRKGCKKALSLVADMAKGIKVTKKRANAAAAASYAAYAAKAADAASYAAKAAYAAANASYAAYAANAADAAADAAAKAADAASYAASYAAKAAQKSRYEEFAEKLLEFLREA